MCYTACDGGTRAARRSVSGPVPALSTADGATVKALVINRTPEKSPRPSDAEAPAAAVADRLVERGHEWAHSTGRATADHLHGAARALAAVPLGASE